MKKIAHIENAFKEKFGIPRQSGLASSLKSIIVFEKNYRNPDALRGLEDFSHLWVIWEFSKNKPVAAAPTVRPPRLGGNIRKGVFATRSPYRPNPIGLSSVKIDKIDLETSRGPIIYVSGADLMDGTPIYDIKPYIYTDCHPEANSGFAEHTKEHYLDVLFDKGLSVSLSNDELSALTQILTLDPRPSYQNEPTRTYGMRFGQYNIKFKVVECTLTVTSIDLFKT